MSVSGTHQYSINPLSFREYDIRGLVDDDLSPPVLTALGAGFGRFLVGLDRPTDVLSFASGEQPGGDRRPGDPPVMLGDIVVAYETSARDAARADKPLADHLQHLVVHGLLHLLGYDHETDDDARRMEAMEVEILRRLGVGDPYGSDAASP